MRDATAHLVARFLQGLFSDLVELFKSLDVHWTTFCTADIVEDAIDSLLRVVSRDSTLRIG